MSTTKTKDQDQPKVISAEKRAELLNLRRRWKKENQSVEDKKEELKEAKARLRGVELKLGALIDNIDQPDLPFADKGDGWQQIELSDACPGLSERIITKLADAEIRTVGELANYSSTHGEQWYQKLSGIGESAAQKIDAELDLFWKRRDEALAAESNSEAQDESEDEDE